MEGDVPVVWVNVYDIPDPGNVVEEDGVDGGKRLPLVLWMEGP